MAYSIHITNHESYLHAVITGENSRESVDGYLTDIERALEHHHTTSVLVEEHLTGPGLDTFDVFDIIRIHAKSARTHHLRIAYVDVNKARHHTSVAFAVNLANILGVFMNVFSTVEEAKHWLESFKASAKAS